MSEAAGPLNAAVDGLLQADGLLMAALGGPYIYSGEGPAQDAAIPDYIELDSDGTAGFDRMNRQFGEQPSLEIEVWSLVQRPDGSHLVGKGRTLELAGHVSRILNHRVFDLAGFGKFHGFRAELLRTIKEQEVGRVRGSMIYTGWATR